VVVKQAPQALLAQVVDILKKHIKNLSLDLLQVSN
jgi:hypothetical protein